MMQRQPLLASRRGFLAGSALAAVPVLWAAPAVAGVARSGERLPRKGGFATPVTPSWYDLTTQTVAAAAFPEAIAQSRTWAVIWLAAQVPSQQSQLDAALSSTLAGVPDGPARQAGITAGQRQAATVLAERRGDGTDTASVDIPYTPPPPGPGICLAAHTADLWPGGARRAGQCPPVPPVIAGASRHG